MLGSPVVSTVELLRDSDYKARNVSLSSSPSRLRRDESLGREIFWLVGDV